MGNSTHGHLEQLYLMERRVTRMITFSNYNTPRIAIERNLNLFPLNNNNRIGIQMYKYTNNVLPPAINDL